MRGKAREDIKNWSHQLSRNSTWLSNSQRKLEKWLHPTLYNRDKTKAMKARKKGPNISPNSVRQSASVNENSLLINLCLLSPILILGSVCFGCKWFQEIIFRKIGYLVGFENRLFRKCFSVDLSVGCKMISVFILPSNIIFRKTERERVRVRSRLRTSLRLCWRPRDFAPRTHEPIFDFTGESRAQITPRTQSLRPRVRAFDPPIFDPEPSTHEPSTSPATQSLRLRRKPMNRSLSLCDFDFCCCCGGVLVVFLLCDGGFCVGSGGK